MSFFFLFATCQSVKQSVCPISSLVYNRDQNKTKELRVWKCERMYIIIFHPQARTAVSGSQNDNTLCFTLCIYKKKKLKPKDDCAQWSSPHHWLEAPVNCGGQSKGVFIRHQRAGWSYCHYSKHALPLVPSPDLVCLTHLLTICAINQPAANTYLPPDCSPRTLKVTFQHSCYLPCCLPLFGPRTLLLAPFFE